MDRLSRPTVEAVAAACGEPMPARLDFRSLGSARAQLHGPIQPRSGRRVRAAARCDTGYAPREEPDRSSRRSETTIRINRRRYASSDVKLPIRNHRSAESVATFLAALTLRPRAAAWALPRAQLPAVA